MLDHRSLPPCSNLSMGIPEGCFILDFASLPLEGAPLIYLTMCTKVVVKHQSLDRDDSLPVFPELKVMSLEMGS